MFCKNCGKELSDNAFICPDCGEPVLSSDSNKNNCNSSAVDNRENTIQCENGELKKNVFANLGFICALISFVFAVPYLVCNMITDLSDYDLYVYAYYSIGIDMNYDVAASVTMGLVTTLLAIVSLMFSIVGLFFSKNNSSYKERAFALSGIIICSVELVTLIACYCVCAIL